jgi:hypothetical protein
VPAPPGCPGNVIDQRVPEVAGSQMPAAPASGQANPAGGHLLGADGRGRLKATDGSKQAFRGASSV